MMRRGASRPLTAHGAIRARRHALVALVINLRLVGLLSARTDAPVITRADVDPARYLALGASPDFAAAARVLVADASAGSGVLVGSTWVITAAHVVRGRSIDSISVVVGDSTHHLRRVVLYDSVMPSAAALARTAHDVALLELETASCVKPMPLAQSPPVVGMVVTMVGFGVGGAGARDTAGTRRGARNRIDQIGGQWRQTALPSNALLLDFDDGVPGTRNAMGTAEPEELEGLAAGGDSGGGLFVQERGEWRLLATFSLGLFDVGAVAQHQFGGSVDLFVGIEGHRGWIEETIRMPRDGSAALRCATRRETPRGD